MRLVANRNECENGVKIIDPANISCDAAQAVVMSGLYLCRRLIIDARAFSECLMDDGCQLFVGDATIQGRKIEPVNDIMENRRSAREPFLAMSPTTSIDAVSSATVFALWRQYVSPTHVEPKTIPVSA
jgi:hypothetical protein